ncbi:hypothetical protein, partial [Scytonema sp. NUACC26]|uniref:hypothetical protein n=1 Tax=Scytonema sp. NUACC26 TaxID=3140176 RepID=UPI0038B334E4
TLNSAQTSFPQDINFNNQDIQPAQSTPIESVNPTVDVGRTDRTADTPIVQTALTQPTTPNPISTSNTVVESEQESLVAKIFPQQATFSSPQTSFPQDTSFNNQDIQPSQSTPIESVNPAVDVDRTDRTADTPIVQTALTQPTTPNPISTSNTVVESEQESLVAKIFPQQATFSSPQTSFPQDTSFNNQDIQPSQSTPNESVNPTVDVDRTDRTADTPIVQTVLTQPTTPNPISTFNKVVENEQASPVATTSVQQPTLDFPQTSFPQDTSFNNHDIQPSQSTPNELVNPTIEVDRTDRTADTPVLQTGQELPDLAFDNLSPPQGYAVGGQVVALSSPNKQQIAASDTVPAMLTPGEFVVNAKDAQKNLSLLKQINNGNTISNYLQTSSLSRKIEDRRQEVEKKPTFFKQQKIAQLGLPKMLGSLGSSSLQLKTENLNLSTLSSLESNSRENKMGEGNQSISHYSLSPLIFKKQVSPKDSSSQDADLPSQWSSIEELAKGNSLTTNSIGFTSSKPIGEEFTSQNLANSLKSKSSRAFTHQLPEIKSFAKGGQVTASQTQMSVQPSRETVERPLLPTSEVDDRSSTLFETLAHEIYYWLRQRLEVEQERYGFYSGRGRIPW